MRLLCYLDVSPKNWLALCCITDNSAQISVSVKRPFGEMYRNRLLFVSEIVKKISITASAIPRFKYFVD
jgi:hypothetical protein